MFERLTAEFFDLSFKFINDNSLFNFQKPASLGMEKVVNLHEHLLILVFGLIIFILLLLIFVIFRFHESRNKIPSNVTHSNTLEVIWAVIPLCIVIFFAFRAVTVLKFVNIVPAKTDLTLKVVGNQWYWSYEYPEQKLSFDSYMKQDEDLLPGDFRLLSTDNPIYLPINKNIKVLITASDVIHSWAVPAFGIKTDAVPGRLNETWINITKPGHYFGQCSELCGILHGFMPIEIFAVSQEEFDKWIASKTEPIEKEQSGDHKEMKQNNSQTT